MRNHKALIAFAALASIAFVTTPLRTVAQENVSTASARLAQGDDYSQLTAKRSAAVDAALTAQMAADNVTGVAIGVIEKGHIVYLKGYGKADEAGTPITAHTMFRWASCSKCLTAIAAMQLAERGQLDLDADVRRYVPEFPDKGAGITITPRLLLCHQSGIPHYSNGKIVATKRTYTDPHPFTDVVTALDTFKESPLLFTPGAKYSYSTYAYILLSAVVQRAGKQNFADQVQERITGPLNLTTLQPDYQWQSIPLRAGGFQRTRAGQIKPSDDTDVSWKLGGGGYISSIEDMARFAQGLLEHRLVRRETEAAMWTPQRTRTGEKTDDGLGFFVDGDPTGPSLRISHGGAQEKTRTRIVLYPNRNSAVVVMCNCEWADPGHFSTAAYRGLASAR